MSQPGPITMKTHQPIKTFHTKTKENLEVKTEQKELSEVVDENSLKLSELPSNANLNVSENSPKISDLKVILIK
jgi:hypothetical protein